MKKILNILNPKTAWDMTEPKATDAEEDRNSYGMMQFFFAFFFCSSVVVGFNNAFDLHWIASVGVFVISLIVSILIVRVLLFLVVYLLMLLFLFSPLVAIFSVLWGLIDKI